MTRGTDIARADVVQFWRTVEMFSPHEVTKAGREQQIFTVEPGQPLPWEADHDLAQWKPRPDQAWRHAAYLGIYRGTTTRSCATRSSAPSRGTSAPRYARRGNADG